MFACIDVYVCACVFGVPNAVCFECKSVCLLFAHSSGFKVRCGSVREIGGHTHHF